MTQKMWVRQVVVQPFGKLGYEVGCQKCGRVVCELYGITRSTWRIAMQIALEHTKRPHHG